MGEAVQLAEVGRGCRIGCCVAGENRDVLDGLLEA